MDATTTKQLDKAVTTIDTALGNINTNLNSINSQFAEFTATQTNGYSHDLITGGMGLFGVLIGTLIAYYFNKILSDSDRKSRIMIQRKNLFYSKIYKELKDIENTFEKLSKNSFKIEINTKDYRGYESFYANGQHIPTPTFKNWEAMKNDIRELLISNALRIDFDNILQKIKEYELAKERYESEKKSLNSDTNPLKAEMLSIYQTVNRNTRFDLSVNDYEEPSDFDAGMNDTARNLDDQKNRFMELYSSLARQILELPSRTMVKTKFNELANAVEISAENLRKTIKDIITKYEYGDEL